MALISFSEFNGYYNWDPYSLIMQTCGWNSISKALALGYMVWITHNHFARPVSLRKVGPDGAQYYQLTIESTNLTPDPTIGHEAPTIFLDAFHSLLHQFNKIFHIPNTTNSRPRPQDSTYSGHLASKCLTLPILLFSEIWNWTTRRRHVNWRNYTKHEPFLFSSSARKEEGLHMVLLCGL